MLGILLAALLAIPAAWADDPFEAAEWLRDPVFDGWDPVDLYHREKEPRPEIEGPRNVHTLFRKTVTLPGAPARAHVAVTADDRFKLYINGAYVTQGPTIQYPFRHPYMLIDVSEYLQPGENVIASHCYYQGLYNRVWNSGDRRAGFMLALTATFEDGSAAQAATDATWRCYTLDAHDSDRLMGYQTQFAEDIDMRRIPKGWREAGFDDSGWATPLTGQQDHRLVLQETPPLQEYRVEPVLAKRVGEGRYFYDFGREIVGHTRIRVQGPEGQVIDVRHGEELSAPDTVRHDLRAGCVYQELVTLSGGSDTIEFYDYKAFRYLEIHHAPTEPEVWVDVRHHPFDPHAARFDSSDELLERIWQICRNAIWMGSQEGFLDCPTREKGQYLGDALIAGHAHLVLTGDPSLVRKALADFHDSQRIHPGMMGVAPGSFMQEIAEYSLQWPLLLETYWRYSGDRDFVARMAESGFPGIFDYFAGFEGELGLITGMDEKWVLVDWPANLRDNYDYDYAKTRENTVLNAFYYGALEAAARILRDLGRDASAYEAKAEQVKAAMIEHLIDPSTGLFLDAPGSSHSALHANALPLYFGLVPEANVPAVLELIRQKRLSCGVYIAAFVIDACYRAGAPELGYDLLTSKDEHSWHEMLKHGATTCMEAWGPDQKRNSSWLHPWASSPVFLVAERVMGLAPAAPGWDAVRFAPAVPPATDRMEVAVPTRKGRFWVRYEKEKGYTLTLPEELPVEHHLPDGVPFTVRVAGPDEPAPLTEFQRATLDAHGWRERVGGEIGVWISVDEQMFRIVQGDAILWQRPCATAEKGTGSVVNSLQTPLGWHSIRRKTGDGEPWGRVFRGGQATRQVWQPGDDVKEDLVLTRVLFLDGEEPGKNKGGNVDSYARYIYIHGTNDEGRIGTPSSHGCIRLFNDDAIDVYPRLDEGTYVLITEGA